MCIVRRCKEEVRSECDDGACGVIGVLGFLSKRASE